MAQTQKKSSKAFLIIILLAFLVFVIWSYKTGFGAMDKTIDSFFGWK